MPLQAQHRHTDSFIATPHQGSGAGFAIVDAYILSDVLSLVKTPAQLPAAFNAYNSVRRSKGLDLVTTSHDTGLLWDLEMPGIGDDISKFNKLIEHRLDWIWNENLVDEAAEAARMMQRSDL